MDQLLPPRFSFMTANFLGREKNYCNVTGFGEGNTSLAEAFSPAATYPDRIDALLGEIAEMGFDAIDLWTAHCNPDWATRRHIDGLLAACDKHRIRIVSIAGGLGDDLGKLERTCRLAADLQCPFLGMGCAALPKNISAVAEILRRTGVKLAFENHPKETTPEIVLEKIGGGAHPEIGVAFDSGWWGTHDYPVLDALDKLRPHVFLVHLKDIQAPGAHVAARWGTGCVDIRGVVRRLKQTAFPGWISLEYEPLDKDPRPECKEFLSTVRQWWTED